MPQQVEANRVRRIPRQQVLDKNHVAEALAHLGAVHPHHCRVHPHADERPHPGGAFTLCNLAFVVWKDEVGAAAMDGHLLAEVVMAHGRTLDVPTGTTSAPWAPPTRLIFTT